ncbi:glutamine-synthetase adenylyltransferase [Aliishimia ponticola]|uniref:Glutamine-synthetase adenylyltransferase n=1 Tax=Aliishimia ponticola TaxID=2499833 RepID=A0A4S4NGW7_9RHOB|nr:glutamine-synthetase adenylyltransferase [Aliishimia ponticola]THH38914.1 glutamine-synthetase adenylyltransferase [Aliishimia ponticola]
MTTSSRLTLMPRAYHAQRGAELREMFPQLDTDLRDLIAGAGGSAPYLAGLIQAEAEWLTEAIAAPEAAIDAVMADIPEADPAQIGSVLRRGKRRVALMLALMDLGGVWPLHEVTGRLTRFAALACDVALKAALAPLLRRGKVPGQSEDDLPSAAGMVILAMGKMGAGELNYSSDIDLICLFDQDRFDPDTYLDARSAFVKATRTMSRTLSDATGEGYVFRTDLRLRPDPSVTPVCLAMETAETYYESLGRTWERAAYIKAHPVAGDLEAGARFLAALKPFVWRKHLDFAAIEDAHNMRLAIREHKGLGGPITLPGHNMKLGRGGIREIEFYTQTRQLIAGGRDPSLRVRGTCEGLKQLALAGWVPEDLSATLTDHYIFHRTVEHRVQMVQDAQTHNLPATDAEFDRLACMMGREAAALKSELRARLTDVHAATEGFFAPDTPSEDDATPELLTEEVISRWTGYPALRTDRARTILSRLLPELENRLAKADRPPEALLALDGFLAGLPAGVQLLSLFEANPQLIDLVLDVVSISSDLATYLSRNAQVLDAVIGGDFFAEWPGQEALEASLLQMLGRFGEDYEARLDAARRWQKEWHFRIGVQLLRSVITAQEAGAQYADLARAVVHVLWPIVQQEFARRHGPAPGRGAVILGMGAVGARQMNSRSDLDLIVIYDAEGQDTSEGKRPLATRPYFARLTQAMITAISAPMSEGRLYEVDMRLRPSGSQGPVATSWNSFRTYQQTEAWTWEHLALTRADVIAGPEDLSQDVRAFRDALLCGTADPAEVAKDVAQMRARIASAKPSSGWLDVKAGPGRMQDIDLFAQTGALLTGQGARAGLAGGLAELARRGVLEAPEDLTRLHDLYWTVLVGGRLLSSAVADAEGLGRSGCALLLRMTGMASLDELRAALTEGQQMADRVISDGLNGLRGGDD